jgi:hypothetical protein
LDKSNGLAIKIKDKSGIITFTLNPETDEAGKLIYGDEILIIDNKIIEANKLTEGFVEYNVNEFKNKEYIIARTIKYPNSFFYNYTPIIEGE